MLSQYHIQSNCNMKCRVICRANISDTYNKQQTECFVPLQLTHKNVQALHKRSTGRRNCHLNIADTASVETAISQWYLVYF